MPLSNSIWSMLSSNNCEPRTVVVERIRAAMLAALEHNCRNDQEPLSEKICGAQDIEELWLLRQELSSAVSQCHHALVAKKIDELVEAHFDGHLASKT